MSRKKSKARKQIRKAVHYRGPVVRYLRDSINSRQVATLGEWGRLCAVGEYVDGWR